jgi:alkylation response protein AidB-like acyl-CoA dehydrogenase
MSAADLIRMVRLGVPLLHGGAGGSLHDAVEALASLAARDPTEAAKLWGHRLLIECLLQSFNIGLRDYHLPALLDRSITGTTALWPQTQPTEPVAVIGTDTRHGWRLSGRLPATPNLDSDWWIAAIPIAFPGRSTYSVGLVSSEHDGAKRADESDTLHLEHVLFREDELIATDGPALIAGIRANWCYPRRAEQLADGAWQQRRI